MSTAEMLIQILPTGDDWRDHAVCKGRTKLFFPPKAERPQARARREAQANLLCSTCPVHQQCKGFARENREYGFWAGESEEDRHLLGFTVAAPIGIRARLSSR
jgi:WhiB family transcriptional regulator, redox-sensing transcriptional regulator